MARLTADFSAAFSRDIKKKARKRGWDLSELEKVIDLVVENSPDSLETLRRRHNMHALSVSWSGRKECHVANAGDWLVIWSSNDKVAFFERTGSHDELFR
ncbi:MAG TPA: type II toxin-antitoxin system YafQ family toxin [Candidatus Olsenella excrementavium]|uniref:Type II toxin-antitoxin system YafQ family toxin n=1 Tax=Candidatus Olsenella excrementavium TaxID=2838709 RepID=A0A9D1ZB94_9ACTN|nr:type II toxin-antitoxin system YafQ family toxin [Candidatus Olsenella excrementavium]